MEPLEYIARDLKKAQKVNYVIAGVTAVFAVVILLLPSKSGDQLNQFLFAGFVAALSIGCLVTAYFKNPERNILMVALRTKPDDIINVYVKRNIINGGHHSTVLVWVLQNAEVVMTEIPKNAEELWMGFAKQLAPNAKFGYEDVLAKQ